VNRDCDRVPRGEAPREPSRRTSVGSHFHLQHSIQFSRFGVTTILPSVAPCRQTVTVAVTVSEERRAVENCPQCVGEVYFFPAGKERPLGPDEKDDLR
jgi:hypothetical protein